MKLTDAIINQGRLASAGPDWKHFCGAHSVVCRTLWGCASSHNDKNRWCQKGEVRKGDAKTSPAETSMDSAVKPNESKNYNRLNNSSLARYIPDQKEGTSVVPAERYWLLLG